MNQYMIQKAGKLNNDTNIFNNISSVASSGFSTAHKASPTSNIRLSIWSFQSIENNRSDNRMSKSMNQIKTDIWSQEKKSVLENEKTNTSK